MGAPDNMGYLPDGPVEMAFTWLKAALDCKNFHWDGDQHECASHSLEDARKYQARVLASLADTQAEIARLRGALESASNYIDNLGGVSKTFRSYLNQ